MAENYNSLLDRSATGNEVFEGEQAMGFAKANMDANAARRNTRQGMGGRGPRNDVEFIQGGGNTGMVGLDNMIYSASALKNRRTKKKRMGELLDGDDSTIERAVQEARQQVAVGIMNLSQGAIDPMKVKDDKELNLLIASVVPDPDRFLTDEGNIDAPTYLAALDSAMNGVSRTKTMQEFNSYLSQSVEARARHIGTGGAGATQRVAATQQPTIGRDAQTPQVATAQGGGVAIEGVSPQQDQGQVAGASSTAGTSTSSFQEGSRSNVAGMEDYMTSDEAAANYFAEDSENLGNLARFGNEKLGESLDNLNKMEFAGMSDKDLADDFRKGQKTAADSADRALQRAQDYTYQWGKIGVDATAKQSANNETLAEVGKARQDVQRTMSRLAMGLPEEESILDNGTMTRWGEFYKVNPTATTQEIMAPGFQASKYPGFEDILGRVVANKAQYDDLDARKGQLEQVETQLLGDNTNLGTIFDESQKRIGATPAPKKADPKTPAALAADAIAKYQKK